MTPEQLERQRKDWANETTRKSREKAKREKMKRAVPMSMAMIVLYFWS